MPGSRKPVLVSGALGQLGRQVTAILLSRGHRVIAVDLRTSATLAAARDLTPAPGEPGELVPAFVNLLDEAALRSLLAERPVSAVVHLAASVAPSCYRNPAAARRVNVDGTANLVTAVSALATPPMFVQASSTAVYGPRNPHRLTDLLTADTPLAPVDCYGTHKVAAERIVAGSGLPHAILRLAGIVSPDGVRMLDPDYFVLLRATPRDNRVHTVDVRDAALAFANAAESTTGAQGRTLLIGGGESYRFRQWEIQDDMMRALGVGALGPSAFLPGDPDDDRGWGLTDWLDTAEAERILGFQRHTWDETRTWVAGSLGRLSIATRASGPVLRVALRGFLAAQRRWEHRGGYADPWALISAKYGIAALATGAVAT
ncbi:Oxidoreductase [Frankia sp. AiPs1]|uniref:NAD-dependent epimerase/dehydratase family protein n=1 Tax=Frankia sp. AiPa1 TaxID=573492 RepID=UPI00202BA38E|nr:NAD(P)-dependent oxidoreductase [Frankia sp. AiPa1]MCL9762755.1 NAD(P)-dependent oxidoreductase [Frankia sp. AiPa1]